MKTNAENDRVPVTTQKPTNYCRDCVHSMKIHTVYFDSKRYGFACVDGIREGEGAFINGDDIACDKFSPKP